MSSKWVKIKRLILASIRIGNVRHSLNLLSCPILHNIPRGGHRLNAYVSPKLIGCNLIPSVMVFKGVCLWEALPSWVGINDIIKETIESPSVPSTRWEHSEKITVYLNQEVGSHQIPNLQVTWSSNLQNRYLLLMSYSLTYFVTAVKID